MIGHQAVNRTLDDGHHVESLCLCRLLQRCRIVVRHRTDEMYRQVGTLVRHDILAEELTEILNHQVAQQAVVLSFDDEQRRRGEETVCQRFAVHLLDDVRLRQLRLCQEFVADGCICRILEDGIHKHASQDGSTALVAKDIAQRWRVLHDVVTVVQATVGTRAQNAGNALLVLAQCACSRHQVAVHFHLLGVEHFAQHLFHHRHVGGRTATTVEKHLQVGHQGLFQYPRVNELCTRER